MIENHEKAPALEAWVEPEIRTLDIAETNGLPFVGGDGGIHSDCSRS